ncbi:MAG TPA: tetratricopeptide repeat protein [Kofleriaceae bacterium]
MDQHLDPDTLAAYVDGRLEIEELGSADRHIDACGSCRTELSALAAAHTLPAPTAPEREVPEGKLGRYHVLRELGRGSMGVVLRAYDPELARPVAIKLLRDVQRDELRDEARTLARLRHPNVITVYDVFTDEHGTYLAMELVDGDTLRGFTKGRSQAQVLAACVRAGRGLAAAHDAGVIHRDFKPENVLCGDDGDVRVSDFGLARPADAAADGAIAGTPVYMAPEVLRREPATAASDQYSYCVTVHEMLTGSRPGDKGPVSTGPALPGWVARALRRGLARDPKERFASMHELVAALGDDPRVRRRRRLLFAGAVAGALATGALVVKLASSSATASCPLDERALDETWNAQRAQDVTRAFAALNVPVDPVTHAFDNYARAWHDVRREACAATHERGEQSKVALGRRVECLERCRRQLGELVRVMASANAKVAGKALERIYGLRDPVSCTGDESYTLPADPVARVLVEEARTLLDRATAMHFASRLDTADALATHVVSVATPLDVPGLVAEALLIQARINIDRDKQDLVAEQLYNALHAAERAKDDRLVAEVWIELVTTTGAQNHRFELAASNARAAEAAVARVGSVDLQIRYANAVGLLALAQAKFDDARKHLEHALELAGPEPRRIGQRGMLMASLCDVERQAGKLAAAHAHCAKALDTLAEAFGPDHMRVAMTFNVLGGVAFAERDWATAETSYKRVIEILDRRNWRQQINYALALSNLGAVYSSRDKLAEARTYFERALAAFDADHPKHPQRLLPLQGLAGVALRTGDAAAAVQHYTQVRDVMAATYAPEHPNLLVAHYNLALAYIAHEQPAKAKPVVDELIARALTPKQETWMLAARGLDLAAQLADDKKDHRAALGFAQRALEAATKANDANERALVLRHLGEIHRHMNKPALAIAPLEQAITAFGKDPDAYDVGATRHHLAFALWDSGRDRKRAVEVARQGAADLAKAKSGNGIKQYRERLAEFLRQHDR